MLCHYEIRYDELVNQGKDLLAGMETKSFSYDELCRMVNHLEKYKDSYLLFMRDYEAPLQTMKRNEICAIAKLGRKYLGVPVASQDKRMNEQIVILPVFVKIKQNWEVCIHGKIVTVDGIY